jgi:hypothetical protein
MIVAAAVLAWATGTAPAQYTSGEFALRLFDKTGTVDITSTTQTANMNSNGTINASPTAASWFVFRAYLVQNPGPGPSIDAVGVSSVGVRLNYANTSGTGTPAARVPAATGTASSGNILNNDEFDYVIRYGTGTGTDTTSSAALTEGLISDSDIVPLPGDFGDSGRFYIGTFKMQGQGSGGVVKVTATDPFNPGNDIATGPAIPMDGFLVPIIIDPYLTDYATPPSFASFNLIVVPEPASSALCAAAAIGVIAYRRRTAR